MTLRVLPLVAALLVQMVGGTVPPALTPLCGGSGWSGPCVAPPLRLGSWNLQRFGVTKMSLPEVVVVLVGVVRTFDMLVLQEVTDASGTAVVDLLTAVNAGLDPAAQYSLVVSPRIGRTTYKEQYAFIYKTSRLTFVSGYRYLDQLDVFQVEPYVALFSSTSTGSLQQFAVIPLHAKPSDAVKEIDALVDVYDDMVTRLSVHDAVILGDFNAGCTYVQDNQLPSIRLVTDSRFHWLITNHADTTTKGTNCPYDRIVAAGVTLQAAVYPRTAAPYYFDEILGIQNDQTLIENVSDHYPVVVAIRGTVPANVSAAYPNPPSPGSGGVRVGVSVSLPSQTSWSLVLGLLSGLQSLGNTTTPGPDVVVMNNLMYAEWSSGSVSSAVSTLRQLSHDYPLLISTQAVAVLGYKAGQGVLNDSSLDGEVGLEPQGGVRLSLLCRTVQGGLHGCDVTLTAATSVN